LGWISLLVLHGALYNEQPSLGSSIREEQNTAKATITKQTRYRKTIRQLLYHFFSIEKVAKLT
jgi:hypothetical protein